jgi:hypothetical protein
MVCLRISAKRSLHSAGRPFIATREAIHSMSARGLPDYWSLLKPQPRSDPQVGVSSVQREALATWSRLTLGGLLSHAIDGKGPQHLGHQVSARAPWRTQALKARRHQTYAERSGSFLARVLFGLALRN